MCCERYQKRLIINEQTDRGPLDGAVVKTSSFLICGSGVRVCVGATLELDTSQAIFTTNLIY